MSCLSSKHWHVPPKANTEEKKPYSAGIKIVIWEIRKIIFWYKALKLSASKFLSLISHSPCQSMPIRSSKTELKTSKPSLRLAPSTLAAASSESPVPILGKDATVSHRVYWWAWNAEWWADSRRAVIDVRNLGETNGTN